MSLDIDGEPDNDPHADHDQHGDQDLERMRRQAQAQAEFDQMKAAYEARYAELEGSSEDSATKARQLLRQTSFECANRLLYTVMHSPNEKLAVDTARWILDRTTFAKAGGDTDEVSEMMAQFFADDSMSSDEVGE